MSDLCIQADISDSSNQILKELALPAATQVGQALGNVFGLFNTLTLPLKFGNQWAQRNFAIFSEKLESIEKDKIKQVEPEIAIPIIEKLSYTSNEDLANAFANLLSNASNKDKVDLIHPGFINKLQNISPDEARLLQYFRNHSNDYPYIIYKGINSKDNSFKYISLHLTGLEKILNLTSLQMAVHLDNLISLNILKDNEGNFKKSSAYDFLENTYKLEHQGFLNEIQLKKYGDLDRIEIIKSFYSITPLGKTFIDACTNSLL